MNDANEFHGGNGENLRVMRVADLLRLLEGVHENCPVFIGSGADADHIVYAVAPRATDAWKDGEADWMGVTLTPGDEVAWNDPRL